MIDQKEVARRVAAGIREEDFAFTVKACGSLWDVYRFALKGKRGTLAFKMVNEVVTIGVFQSGELTEAQVIVALDVAHRPVRTESDRANWVSGYVRNGVKISGYYRGGSTQTRRSETASSRPRLRGPRSPR